MNAETTTNEVTTTENTPLHVEQETEVRPREARSVRWFRPPIDVFESDDAFRIDVDIPGVTAENLELTVERGVLTVEAVRSEARGWRRQLRLTDGIDVENIDAHLEAGVLSLTLPKAAAARARRIEVRGR